VTAYRLNELSTRELRALTLVEAGVALGWIASRWPGLLTEIQRVLPDLEIVADDTDAEEMLNRAMAMAGNDDALNVHPLLGSLPLAYTLPRGLTDKLRRTFGRMPWTTTQKRLPRPYSVPVGGDGGVRNSNLPPPSRTVDDDLDITPDHRPGIPVEEANDAGVSVYYVGIGPTRVDPLPEVFGPRRSQRIRRVEELPRVLAHVHRELVAA